MQTWLAVGKGLSYSKVLSAHFTLTHQHPSHQACMRVIGHPAHSSWHEAGAQEPLTGWMGKCLHTSHGSEGAGCHSAHLPLLGQSAMRCRGAGPFRRALPVTILCHPHFITFPRIYHTPVIVILRGCSPSPPQEEGRERSL